MEKCRLRREGESISKFENNTIKKNSEEEDIVYDAYGNEIKVEKAKTLTDKERNKMIKQLKKKINEGRTKKNLTEYEIDELEEKMEELESEAS